MQDLHPKRLANLSLTARVWLVLILGAALFYAVGSYSAHSKASLVTRLQSPYGMVYVIDEDGYRYLRFGAPNADDQSMISLADRQAVPMQYIRYMSLALAYRQAPQRILMVGLGGGTLSSLLRRAVPKALIDVVEINPIVKKVATTYFRVKEDEHLRIHLADGQRFLERSTQRYDIIALDAYSGKGIPSHLMTAEFFGLVKERLAPHGLLVANIATDTDAQEKQLIATIRTSFSPHLDCYRTTESSNLVLFAAPTGLPSKKELSQRALQVRTHRDLSFSLAPVLRRYRSACQLGK